jgi:hypothetical protein
VTERISNIFEDGKWKDALLVTSLAVTSIVSFGLGRLSTREDRAAPVTVYEAGASQKVDTGAISLVPEGTTHSTLATAQSAVAPLQRIGGSFVASRTGSSYHLPWCSGAKRIKNENKIYFNSKEEAEKAGYKPAANCKGL